MLTTSYFERNSGLRYVQRLHIIPIAHAFHAITSPISKTVEHIVNKKAVLIGLLSVALAGLNLTACANPENNKEPVIMQLCEYEVDKFYEGRPIREEDNFDAASSHTSDTMLVMHYPIIETQGKTKYGIVYYGDGPVMEIYRSMNHARQIDPDCPSVTGRVLQYTPQGTQIITDDGREFTGAYIIKRKR